MVRKKDSNLYSLAGTSSQFDRPKLRTANHVSRTKPPTA